MRQIEWVLRVAMFGEFLGHGVFAYQAVPHFQWLLSKSLGVPVQTAAAMLPVIGVIDFVIAGLALVKPVRAVLLYAVVWGFLTALARPLAGGEIWDFRGALAELGRAAGASLRSRRAGGRARLVALIGGRFLQLEQLQCRTVN